MDGENLWKANRMNQKVNKSHGARARHLALAFWRRMERWWQLEIMAHHHSSLKSLNHQLTFQVERCTPLQRLNRKPKRVANAVAKDVADLKDPPFQDQDDADGHV
jgi:hypothetical protein